MVDAKVLFDEEKNLQRKTLENLEKIFKNAMQMTISFEVLTVE